MASRSRSKVDSVAFQVTEEEMDWEDPGLIWEDEEDNESDAAEDGSEAQGEATWLPNMANQPAATRKKSSTHQNSDSSSTQSTIMASLDEEDETFLSRTVEGNAAEEMYNSVIFGGSRLKGSVQDWIELYAMDAMSALATLFQFICRCSQAEVAFETISQIIGSPHLINSVLLPEAGAHWLPNDYLMSTKKYAPNLETFWKQLMHDIPDDFVCDDVFLKNLLQMFLEMCVSKVRPLRHTAAVAAMCIMPNIELYRQMLKHETRSYNETQTIKKKVSMLDKSLTQFFAIFHNSCRDVVHKVRNRCLQAIGELVKINPRRYRGKISYFGKSLGDTVASVRLTTLKTLVSFLELDAIANVMIEFIADHKEQLEDMMHETSKNVFYRKTSQECIVRLVVFLHGRKKKRISLRDRNVMYSWISLENETAARIAGNFVLKNHRDDNVAFRIFDANEQMLLNLANYFTQIQITDVRPYMKNLIELVPELHDWNFMCSLLLKSYKMEHTLKLASLFVCTVENIAAEDTSSRGNSAHQLARRRMTCCVIKHLPKLMSSFGCDTQQMQILTKIPMYFVFRSKLSGEDAKTVEELLHMLADVVKKATNIEVFDSCIRSVRNLSLVRHIKEDAEETLTNMAEDLKEQYLSLLSSVEQIAENTNHDSQGALDEFMVVARKVEIFLCFNNFHGESLFVRSFTMLRNVKDKYLAPHVKRIVLSIVWLCVGGTLKTLLKKFSPDVAQILRGHSNILADICCSYLTVEQVAEKAFTILCHVLNHFTKSLIKKDRKLEVIIINADKVLVGFINVFMNNVVFKDLNISGEVNVGQRIALLKSYLSLVENGCITIADSGIVFRNMFKFNSLYGATMKECLLRLKSADKLLVAEIFCCALVSAGHSARKGIDNWIQDHVQDLGKLFSSLVFSKTLANRGIVREVHTLAIKLAVASKPRGILQFLLLNQMSLFPLRVEEDRLQLLQFSREEFQKLDPDFVNRSRFIREYMDLLNAVTSPGGASLTSSPASKKQLLDSERIRSSKRRSLDFSHAGPSSSTI